MNYFLIENLSDQLMITEDYIDYCNNCNKLNIMPLSYNDFRYNLNIFTEDDVVDMSKYADIERKEKIKKGIKIGAGVLAAGAGTLALGLGINKYKHSKFHTGDAATKGKIIGDMINKTGKSINKNASKAGKSIKKGIDKAGKSIKKSIDKAGKSASSGVGRALTSTDDFLTSMNKAIANEAYEKAHDDNLFLNETFIPNEIYFDFLIKSINENYDICFDNDTYLYLYNIFEESYNKII